MSVNRPVQPLRRGRLRRPTRLVHPRGHPPLPPASGGGAQPPTSGADPSLRWRRGRPAYYGVEWPFWLLMLSPWLAWGLVLLVSHLGLCLICLPR